MKEVAMKNETIPITKETKEDEYLHEKTFPYFIS